MYDSTRFRQRFHGITAFIMFLAFCIDLVVCYKVSGIVFHEEDEEVDQEGGKKNKKQNIKNQSTNQQQIPQISQVSDPYQGAINCYKFPENVSQTHDNEDGDEQIKVKTIGNQNNNNNNNRKQETLL